jgi:osmotically-inducible protein OsmY
VYGGGQYGTRHYGSHPEGTRQRGGTYGDDEAYSGGSMSGDRDVGGQRGGNGRGWYGGEQGWYGGEHSGGGRGGAGFRSGRAWSGSQGDTGDAMGMAAGLGRGSDMTGKGPKGYTRSDDRIKEDVCDCLTDDPHLDASAIEVQVRNCEVTLSGAVDSRGARRHAEDLAERASGVKHVQNNLRVSTGSQAGGSDGGQRTGTGTTTSSIIT